MLIVCLVCLAFNDVICTLTSFISKEATFFLEHGSSAALVGCMQIECLVALEDSWATRVDLSWKRLGDLSQVNYLLTEGQCQLSCKDQKMD